MTIEQRLLAIAQVEVNSIPGTDAWFGVKTDRAVGAAIIDSGTHLC